MPVVRIPKRLEENPLLDVVAEVRFSSQLPPDAIVGMVYASIGDLRFGAPKPEPLLQIPEPLRSKDENLRYGALYRFDRPNEHYLLLGPRSIALGTPRPYKNWDVVAPLLKEVLGRLGGIGLMEKVERTGLRYVNFFEGLNVLNHAQVVLELAGNSIVDQNAAVREERTEGNFLRIIQLLNQVTSIVEGKSKTGSVLDIDVICQKVEVSPGNKNLAEELGNVFLASNQIADRAFFGLLKPDLIAKYRPVY